MGSKISKAKRSSKAKNPTFAKTKTTTIPRIPQEIIDEILVHLTINSLQSCALVSKSWVPACRRHLFHTILFASKGIAKWLETFPVPEESPAHFVRDLRFSIEEGYEVFPEAFFEYFPWFTNVEGVTFMGREIFGVVGPLWTPPLSHSATSLTFGPVAIATEPMRVRNIMVQPRNPAGKDGWWLPGPLVWVSGRTLLGVETILKGRFGGRLRLFGERAVGGVVDALLEVPTGLHFTGLDVCCPHECLLSTVKLAEACSKTLVRLSYTVFFHVGSEAFEGSFDFSEFPNLQEVDFVVGSIGGGLPWIPTALSTLKPVTSPHLSAIRVCLHGPPITDPSIETVIEETGDDLRRVAYEVARIERAFGGMVKVTLLTDTTFDTALERLNITFRS